jgi:beta-galactosidase
VWGGLYRKVWLIATDPLHIDPTDFASPGVYITPNNVTADGADLGVRVLLFNQNTASAAAQVRASLLDPSGRSVQVFNGPASLAPHARASVALNGHVDHPQLWAPRDPRLYHLKVEVLQDGLVTDSVNQPTGFRSFVMAGGKVILNGKPMLLAGADLHQEIESKASAMSDDDFRTDYDLVMDMGANWMRLPHYPHAQFEYDLCDELGVGVWAENGHSNRETPSPTGERITTEMVKQNFNHPSILVWSVGNEASADSAEAYYPIVKALDPLRPVGVANMRANNVDFHGANTYPGWYGKSTNDGFSLNATGYISETGAGGVVTVHCDYAAAKHITDKYEPEEYQQQVAEQIFQKALRENDGKLGILTWWTMRDFTDNKYKGKTSKVGWNTKGLLTYAGDKKDVYFLYRCFLRPDLPTVHITSKRYFLRMGNVTNGVKAYSNARHLTLTLNGTTVSTLDNGTFTQASGRHIDNVFFWPAPLRTGKNDVLVADEHGNSDSAVIYFYGAGGEPEVASSTPLLKELKTSSAANIAYYMDMPVQPQWPIYYDLDTTADNSFDELPDAVKGATWIAIRRPTKEGQEAALTFTLARAATVLIMASKADAPPPFVSSGFEPVAGGNLVWRDNNLMLVPAELFSHSFAAGATVHLPEPDRDQIIMFKE